jgi:hypothetical protein
MAVPPEACKPTHVEQLLPVGMPRLLARGKRGMDRVRSGLHIP